MTSSGGIPEYVSSSLHAGSLTSSRVALYHDTSLLRDLNAESVFDDSGMAIMCFLVVLAYSLGRVAFA